MDGCPGGGTWRERERERMRGQYRKPKTAPETRRSNTPQRGGASARSSIRVRLSGASGMNLIVECSRRLRLLQGISDRRITEHNFVTFLSYCDYMVSVKA